MNPLFQKNLIQEAKDRIMTYAEYITLGKLQFPDHFYVRGKGKEILFYQTKHCHDPQHKQFAEITALMQDFKPDKVFVEMQGWVNASDKYEDRRKEILETDMDTIIQLKGDPGFTIKTAIENGLSWSHIISPELAHQDLADYLKTFGYSRDEIFLFYVIRNLGTEFYEPMDLISDEELERNCERFGRILEIPEEQTVELFKTLHKKLLGKDFENDKDHKNYHNLTRPIPNDDGTFGYINKISNISSRFRDETIIEKAANVLEQNNKLMIVYGGSHGTVQKPALEYLLSK